LAHEPQQMALVIVISKAIPRLDGVNNAVSLRPGGK
jgi:hypothetical protein